MAKVSRALLSVSDKTGLVEFAQALALQGIQLISTGGTARTLRDAGLTVTDVSSVTDFPEIMGGRIKTLHPRVHGGLLARRGTDDGVMAEHGIEAIDLLVVNLYPFEETVARPDCSREDAIENIDIGGPAMLRGAAKNHAHVGVVVDPADYADVARELETSGALQENTRRRLATKAFAHTSSYDAAIWGYLQAEQSEANFPTRLPLSLRKIADLRYGENPHQQAAAYVSPGSAGGLVHAKQHQGKALSYNNIADADAALECVKTLPPGSCVIVKHANPCGVGLSDDGNLIQAYERAYATDPTSAFGGIIALNSSVSEALAKIICERQFVEVIAAPEFTADALAALAQKPNIRVLATGALSPTQSGWRLHPIEGGLLVQDKDVAALDENALKVVSKREPTPEERENALLAWQVARFVKSNAIVYCANGATLGIGAGQMSRVVSARIAALKAEEAGLSLTGAAMASDAFFPFRDGIDSAAEHGIGVVIQPGGSMRDDEVIDAANEHGMAMLFTAMRHFRH